jgi:hypothetical protein
MDDAQARSWAAGHPGGWQISEGLGATTAAFEAAVERAGGR